MSAVELREGDEIAGCRLEHVLGRGGMGVVFRARQVALDRPVAVKVVSPSLAHDAEFRRRFEQEARIAASLDHPNVVPVYGAGEDRGHLYIVMRLVEGTDLAGMIAARGRLDPALAVRVVEQIASALDAAHAAGLVHRDIKPANVLVTGDADATRAYLTDFGLTKQAAATAGMTRTGQWLGTLDYAAPEQIAGQRVDARTDVYALGCVLFAALSGEVPFPRDSEPAKLYAHLHDPPPALSEVAPGLPPGLDDVVARALAKEPGDRFPSAGDLARAARALVRGEQVAEPERSVARGEAAPTRRTAPATERATRPARTRVDPPRPEPERAGRGRAIGIAAAVVVLLGAGGAGAAVLLGGEDDPPGPTVTTVETTVDGGGDTETTPPPTTETTDTTTTEGTQRYVSEAYEVDYPADWRVTRDDELVTTFRETRFEGPDGAFVLIDRTPGETTDPERKATEVEQAVAEATRGYRRLSFQPVTIAGDPAFEWTFEQRSGGRLERRVDYFFNRGGDGYAVLGGGQASLDAVVGTARRIAESLATR
jgi:predicted Ser/Thr protein kinase